MECISPVPMSKTFKGNFYQWSRRCGQCMPCRLTRQKQWVAKFVLESRHHGNTWFVTLTYGEKHVPRVSDKPWLLTLRKEDVQLWMKRLRSWLEYRKETSPRYFLVGEYGSRTERPHYHALLFGVDVAYVEKAVRSTWQLGDPEQQIVSELNTERAMYAARYTVKKLTGPYTFSDGRAPEFALMSKKPCLGHKSMPNVLEVLRRYGFSGDFGRSSASVMEEMSTPPGCVRWSGKLWPLDPHLRKIVRKLDDSLPELEPKQKLQWLQRIHRERQKDPEYLRRCAQAGYRAAKIIRRQEETL